MAGGAASGGEVRLETARLLLRTWRAAEAGLQRERHWNTASRRVLAKVGFDEVDCEEAVHGTSGITSWRL